MKNDKLLFEMNLQNSHKRLPLNINNGYIVYKSNQTIIDKFVIKDIIRFINYIHQQFKNIRAPISFEFGKITFIDKLTYIILEIICYVLICDYKHDVFVKFDCEDDILTEGIKSSPLLLLTTGDKQHVEKFIKSFEYELYKRHYRRLLTQEDMQGDKLSQIMDDITYFLKSFDVTEESMNDLAEVIIELIGNVHEHTSADCLVDLDITHQYSKIDSEGVYYGINITVINFSKKLFHEPLKKKLILGTNEWDDRYLKVLHAFDNHKFFFGDNYTEEDFFNIASFQHKISGNEKKSATGGTGLTKLIYSLEKRSDMHMCYMISGRRIFNFIYEYMEYNEDNWIGFNEEKNFFGVKPDKKNFATNAFYLPGTAYNLNFVIR